MTTENDITSMTSADQISFWLGRICVAIGQGSVRSTVWEMIDFYSKVGYERGLREGKTS